MSDDYTPETWDWLPIVTGSTYPAQLITESESDADLVSAVILIEPAGSDVAVLTLSSETSSITITSATAGAWSITVDAISAATMATIPAGYYTVNFTVTDSNGVVTCASRGEWQILEK